MLYRTVAICVLVGSVVNVLAAAAAAKKKSTTSGDRLSGLYIKDTQNGELRFLGVSGTSSTGVGTGSTAGTAAALNQWITQKQNMLEQLRPVTGQNAVTPIIVNVNGGTTTTTGTGTGTGTVTVTGTGTGTGTAVGTGNAAINQAIVNGSPIAQLLPQIVGAAAAGGGTINRRVVPNRRRVNANRRAGAKRRRRPNRKGNKKGPVYVIRPKN